MTRRLTPRVLLMQSLRALVALLFAWPLYWLVVTATGNKGDVYASPPRWVPAFQVGPMIAVVTGTPWLRYVLNSVLITGSTIVLVLLTSILAGYGLAAYRFRGREALFLVLLGALMLPEQALLIPQYVVLYHLRMLNTYPALIIPFAASSSGIFLFRQFFLKLPVSYREVARLEGTSTPQYLRRVAVPLARPIVLTVLLLTFISSWNQFQWPLIMTNSNSLAPIELALSHYMQTYAGNWRTLTSAAFLALLPIVVVFAATQRHIVRAVVGGDSGLNE